jgi:hypothetical protein
MTTKSLNHTKEMIPLESALNQAITCSGLLEILMENAEFDALSVTYQQIIVLTAQCNNSLRTDLAITLSELPPKSNSAAFSAR